MTSKKPTEERYTVLMSVYGKEKPEWLERSIKSMLKQTISADEFIIVEDGALPAGLKKVINKYKAQFPNLFKIIKLEKNVGLGLALRAGLEKSRNGIIARMDSDDYSIPTRMETQLEVLRRNPELSLIGSNVAEFLSSLEDVKSYVVLPEKHEEIASFAKKRTPFRHTTIVFRKKDIEEVGGYRDYPLLEDYDLFIRAIMSGLKCYNVQENLVFMQVSEDFYVRRGGKKYLNTVLRFEKELYNKKFISLRQYLLNILVRSFVTLSPNFLRKLLYMNFLRSKGNQ